ncbi:MAG: hypothetical protein JSR33_10435, partial [Proteobacteria bacterium]|nr:hypothetical protein [Pseudomonadota bacterium]
IFAATTATYFVAKASGVLPSWFWGSTTSDDSESSTTALISPGSTSLVFEAIQPESVIFSKQTEIASLSEIFAPSLVEPALTDFKETDLTAPLFADSTNNEETNPPHEIIPDDEDEIVIDTTLFKTGQRRLLQASSQITIVQNIPDQTIDAAQQYNYYLNGSQIFNGNFTTLIATTPGQNALPDWLQFRTTDIVGAYTPLSARYRDIKIIGNIAYIADYNSGLKLINITDPAHPILIGSGPVGNPLSLDINITNSVVYLANDNEVGLQVVDVSDPIHPTLIASYPLPGSSSGVAVNKNFVYVVSGSYSLPISMYVFNIRNPSNLQPPIGSWTTTSPSPNGGIPVGIQIQNQRAYLGAVTQDPVFNVIYTLDVSNPQAPYTLATYQSGFTFDWYPYISGFKVQGNFLYVGELSWIIIIDISDPQNPSVLSKISDLGAGFIRALEIYGELIYFTADNEGFKIINITNPTSSTPVISQYSTFGHVYDMQIKGNFAYLAADEGGLKIIDLRQNRLTGTPGVSKAGEQFIVRIAACQISGICLNYEDFQLTIDSNLPQVVGSIPDQSIFPGQTLELAISSNILFSHVDQHNLTFQLAVTNFLGSPINPWIYLGITPSLVGQVALNDVKAQYIKVQAGYAYVTLNNGFQIIDVRNPESPDILSTYLDEDFYLDLQIRGDLAYFAGAINGLLIFDVSDPFNPVKISAYNPSGAYLRGLFLGSQSSADLVYLAWCCIQNIAKLEIVDVSISTSIQSLGQLMSGPGVLNMNPEVIQVRNGL